MTTSAAGRFSVWCMSTGMPRPLSTTVTELSACTVVDLIGVAGQGFVDGVVHHFPDQMVQAHLSGRADVHRGPQPHGFQTAKNLDRLGVVLMAALRCGSNVFFIAHHFSPCQNFQKTCGTERTPSKPESWSA